MGRSSEADALRGNLGQPIPENRHCAARGRAPSDAERKTRAAVTV